MRTSRVVLAVVLFGLGIVGGSIGALSMLGDVFTPVTPVPTNRVVQLEAEGSRMLWVGVSEPETTCEVTDSTGRVVGQGDVDRIRMESEHGYLRGIATYEAPGGPVSIDCDGEAMTYESMAFDGAWLRDAVVPMLVPFLLFSLAAGIVVLVEVRSRRRSRAQAAQA